MVLAAGGGNLSAFGRLLLQSIRDLGDDLPESTQLLEGVRAVLTQEQLGDDHLVAFAVDIVRSSLTGAQRSAVGDRGQADAILRWGEADHLDEMAAVSCPYLVLASELDDRFPLPNLRALAARSPLGRIDVLPGVPHVFAAQVGRVERLTVEFFRST